MPINLIDFKTEKERDRKREREMKNRERLRRKNSNVQLLLIKRPAVELNTKFVDRNTTVQFSSVREAAKTFFLVPRPLRGDGGRG